MCEWCVGEGDELFLPVCIMHVTYVCGVCCVLCRGSSAGIVGAAFLAKEAWKEAQTQQTQQRNEE